MTSASNEVLQERIQSLELELATLRNADQQLDGTAEPPFSANGNTTTFPSHQLLLLTDSALPLGSFAFSSGLESYQAHHSHIHNAQQTTLYNFMHMSILSLASTTLPYLVAAFRHPDRLKVLDDELDACLLCPVARRASISQGKALLTVWERSFARQAERSCAKVALQEFSTAIKASASFENDHGHPILHAHFAIIFSVVSLALGLSLRETAYTYLLNHTKAVASAAVRASVVGPYAAQSLLASKWMKTEIQDALEREWDKDVEHAGQTVPALDVWIGRHELLYSRIFNS